MRACTVFTSQPLSISSEARWCRSRSIPVDCLSFAALLCDKLTQNMSHLQWREWVSLDIPLHHRVPRTSDRTRLITPCTVVDTGSWLAEHFGASACPVCL